MKINPYSKKIFIFYWLFCVIFICTFFYGILIMIRLLNFDSYDYDFFYRKTVSDFYLMLKLSIFFMIFGVLSKFYVDRRYGPHGFFKIKKD